MELLIPFANTGEKEDFSTTTDPTGKVSLEKGFTELYELKPEEGGLFILRKVFNQMMNLVTTDTVNWKTQTFPNWIADKGDGLPFAYPKNAIIKATDGENYVSLVDDNEDDPVGSINWSVFNSSDFVDKTTNQTIAGVKTFSSSPIVPTPTTGTQAVNKDYADLKVALADFTGTNQNLSGNGYQKLPGGLILQWGYLIYSGGGNKNIIFPISFPSFCVDINLCRADNVLTNAFYNLITSSSAFPYFSNNNFTFYDQDTSTNIMLWSAIGY